MDDIQNTGTKRERSRTQKRWMDITEKDCQDLIIKLVQAIRAREQTGGEEIAGAVTACEESIVMALKKKEEYGQ